MDAFSLTSLLCLILGILHLAAGQSQSLMCIQCSHIQWNQTLQFEGSESVYRILASKYNIRCSLTDPIDSSQWSKLQQDQIASGFGHIQSAGVIGDTICPAFRSDRYNRCQYIFGLVLVKLVNNDQDITLNMTVHDCANPAQPMDDYCYERDTRLGYFDVINFFRDRLSFLGNVEVKNFYGKQCYCNTNFCTNHIVSGSSKLVAFGAITLLSVLSSLFLT